MREAEAVSVRATDDASGPVSLKEIAEMVQTILPPLPAIAGGDSLGKHAATWRWLASSQHEQKPQVRRPRIALFTAQHGAFPELQDGVPAVLEKLHDGTHTLCALAQEVNADLQVYELNVDTQPRDFRKEVALRAHEAAHAASYGLMAVQPGIDLLVAACLNPAAEKAGEAILAKLKKNCDPLEALQMAGGLDIAALTGALIAARLAHIPVLLDGRGAEAAAAMIERIKPLSAAHTRKASDILEDKQHPTPGLAGALLIAFLKTLAKAG